ncbi:MAG: shikimate dehydrogenase [Brumimicrobium sp.]
MQQKANQQKFGLIGKSLAHSFSKLFFEEKFKKENINATYENIELANENELQNWVLSELQKYAGINVTIPYKVAIIPFLDEVSNEVKEVGAVNTIALKNGKSIGYNTDVYGFRQSIKPFFKGTHERALILGTGGASKAVAYVLKELGVDVAYLSRTPNPDKNIFGYNDVNQYMVNAFKLIINTTPLGTFPNIEEKPNFPIEFVGEEHLVIDLIYNPTETKFLQIAREHGADTLNGLSMLKHQAIRSWEIYQ